METRSIKEKAKEIVNGNITYSLCIVTTKQVFVTEKKEMVPNLSKSD